MVVRPGNAQALKIDEHFGMKDARPVLGKSDRHGGGTGQGASWNVSPEVPNLTGAAHPDAARFVGWDRASRPGWEPIIVAVKPLRGTIAETALRYGTGGMNADGCRIPRGDVTPREVASASDGYGTYGDAPRMSHDARGGFPANVIMDEEAAAELDRQSGVLQSGSFNGARAGMGYGGGNGSQGSTYQANEGGASRFFYTAKASTSERDKGLENLPTSDGRNPHPTVKPISLMRYLVRRASPPGAWDPDMSKRPVVLDCFMGSGSTGVAALVEGVRFVGCELEAASAEVARLRLHHAYVLPRDEDEAPTETRSGGQAVLF